MSFFKGFSRKSIIGAIILLLLGFGAGRISTIIEYPVLTEKAFANFNHSYKEIKQKYLFDIKPDQLINGAAKGMVASLGDPYSVYMPGDQGQNYIQSYQPDFVGIGVEVRSEDGRYVVDSVIKATPAEKGGLRAEDVISKVDGTDISGKTMDELVGMLRGEKGSKVKLTILRSGTPIEVELTRAPIPVTTVSYEMKENGIGKITISRFAQSTADEFGKAFDALQKEGMTSMLLDLRSNPGGLLTPTITIANKLVPKGKLILEVDYKDKKRVETYYSKQDKVLNLPIVVLVNGDTASAAEVLTAALKESAGAKVIGTKTFGKGIVQSFGQFKDQSVLKLTEAQWKTPSGEWIHKKGVEPDEQVELPAYASLSVPPVGTELKQGDYGDNVRNLQTILSVLGYYNGTVSGIFSEATTSSLKSFQTAQGAAVTGVLNDKTSNQLMVLLRNKFQKEDPQLLRGLDILSSK